MSDFRAKSGDLCMSDAMPWQQSWQYRTCLPIADVVNDDFFRSVQSMLRAGDSITVCQFDKFDARGAKLLAFVTVRVASSAPDAVKIVCVGDVVTVDYEDQKPASPSSAGYVVRKQFGGGFAVEDATGNVIEQLKTKAEAEEFAAQFNGKAA